MSDRSSLLRREAPGWLQAAYLGLLAAVLVACVTLPAIWIGAVSPPVSLAIASIVFIACVLYTAPILPAIDEYTQGLATAHGQPYESVRQRTSRPSIRLALLGWPIVVEVVAIAVAVAALATGSWFVITQARWDLAALATVLAAAVAGWAAVLRIMGRELRHVGRLIRRATRDRDQREALLAEAVRITPVGLAKTAQAGSPAVPETRDDRPGA